MKEPHASKIKMNVRKAQGQMKLIEKMIDEKRYCIEIAQQINAAIGLLKKSNNYLLENHLLSCGGSKLRPGSKDREKFASELIQVFNVTGK